MWLNDLTVIDFKSFEGKHVFNFKKINVFQGANGVGKSTIIKDAPLFLLQGYYGLPLEKMPTRGKSKTCSVAGTINDLNVKRDYPTKITLNVGGKEIEKDATNKEKQSYLNDLFKNVDYFRKFRMVDANEGVNILEEGKTGLKKILFSFNEELFNTPRQKLLNKKRDREIYNKDKAVLYTHFPSTKRLDLLNVRILQLTEDFYKIDKDYRSAEQDYRSVANKKAGLDSNLSNYRRQKNEILKDSVCPTCKKSMDETTKKELLDSINTNIKSLNEHINTMLEDLTNQEELLDYIKGLKSNLTNKKSTLSSLRMKLETRIKQKDYKWTNQDVLLVKKAIDELDSFSSYFITEWVRGLEPIINSITNKIGFKIEFFVDKKGNFDIKLHRGDNEFSYKDLSTGQRLIVSIAFQMALLLERGETGLIIADEGFSSLDSENLLLIIELFKEVPFQLICTVHRFYDVPEEVNVICL